MLFDVNMLGQWGNVSYDGDIREPFGPQSECEGTYNKE